MTEVEEQLEYYKGEKMKSNFYPFQQVLVREKGDYWHPRHFERYDMIDNKYLTTDECEWDECIPYESNRCLVGSRNDPEKPLKFGDKIIVKLNDELFKAIFIRYINSDHIVAICENINGIHEFKEYERGWD